MRTPNKHAGVTPPRSTYSGPGRIALSALIALIALAGACTSLIGVEDVSLAPDAAAPGACGVSPEFDLVVSNPATSLLTRHVLDGPDLLFLLNTDAKPDALRVMLFDNMGGHGTLTAPGTYSLTSGDSTLETCGICPAVYANYDSTEETFSHIYWALAQGTLRITRADSNGLAGRLQDLRFRHVDISDDTTHDIQDGCFVAIDDIQFDMTYTSQGE